MINNHYYLTCVKWNMRNYYLFWQEGRNSPDLFATYPGGAIVAETALSSAVNVAAHLSLKVDTSTVSYVDIGHAFKLLRPSRQKGKLSNKEMEVILNVWNVIEDIARTLKIKPLFFGSNELEIMQDVYEEIFIGSDVLSFDSKIGFGGGVVLTCKSRNLAYSYLALLWTRISFSDRWSNCHLKLK